MALRISMVLSLIVFAGSQSCGWGDFNLIGAQGYEIQCVEESGQFAIGT